MSSSQLQILLKNIQDMMKCPSCGARYQAEQIHFLGQLEMTCLVQLDCVECNLPVLAHFVVSDLYQVGSRIVSDLSEADIKKFRRLEPVATDEVLEAHERLEQFSGSVESLFQKRT
jgi:NAD-dependent DNA ligase